MDVGIPATNPRGSSFSIQWYVVNIGSFSQKLAICGNYDYCTDQTDTITTLRFRGIYSSLPHVQFSWCKVGIE